MAYIRQVDNYESFLSIVATRNLSGQYIELQNEYSLFAFDGNLVFECSINDQPSINDFEAKYKSAWNQPVTKIEKETGYVQYKPRPVDGTLMLNNIYFKLGDANSLDAPDEFWSMTVEEGDPGYKITKVLCSPNFGFYMDGGGIRIVDTDARRPIKVNFILAPNIPAEYGGHVVIVGNKKLHKSYDPFNIKVPPKYVKYYPQNPYANQVMVHCLHSESEDVEIELYVQFYR